MVEKLDLDEFAELRDYIHGWLVEDGQDVRKSDLAGKMLSFEVKFPHGIHSMSNFKKWMQAHGYDDDQIMVSIIHDLNDMNEPFMAPRTGGFEDKDVD